MTDLEFEHWKLTRVRGCRAFMAKSVFQKCALFAAPVVITLGAAWLRPGNDATFWEHAGYLAVVFMGVTWVLGCGESLLGWLRREREYARQAGFLHAPLRQRGRITGLGPVMRISPAPCVEAMDEPFLDDSLMREAQSFQVAHDRGLIDLDEKCARFDPLFRASLAKDTFFLAGRARVDEKAAFLALMAQFEN